jgi:quinol monooxygenase YgiN
MSMQISRVFCAFCCVFLSVPLLSNAENAAPTQVVRIAEIELDPQRIGEYKSALREQIEAAIRLEPGVLVLNAVSLKDHPEQVRVFEVYRSQADYQKHVHTPHFLKYKAAVAGIVRNLKLEDVDPILLGAKK